MMFTDATAYPADELTVLNVAMPKEAVAAMDDAIDAFYPAIQPRDRERFVFMAVQYAIESLREEAGGQNDGR